jgi:uncharacterized protein YjbI with pentapeptide repeats
MQAQEELKQILDQHELWLGDITKGKRTDLGYTNLSNAVLSNANLSNTIWGD